MHDAEHTGMAILYNDQSVAKQHLLTVVFMTVKKEGHKELREVLFNINNHT